MTLALSCRFAVAVTLGASIAACGGSVASSPPTSSTDSDLAGSYSNCFVFQSGTAHGADGDLTGAALSVVQDGPALSATFTQGSNSSTLHFTPIADAVATLASSGESLTPGVQCTATDTGFSDATLTASSGTLSRASNAIFLSVVGTVAAPPSATSPCAQISGVETGGVSIVCEANVASSTTPAASGAPMGIPTGVYSCTADISSYGPHDQLLTGGNGSITVTESGADLTATFNAGQNFPTGTLQLVSTTATTASAASGDQSLSAACILTSAAPQSTLDLSSSALAMIDGTLFMTFAGAFDASCEGLVSAGSAVCTKE
jgi:hypothetical protein